MLPVELWFVFGSRINFPMSVELQSSAFMESFVQIYFFYSSILHAIISHAEISGGGGGEYAHRTSPHWETVPENLHP